MMDKRTKSKKSPGCREVTHNQAGPNNNGPFNERIIMKLSKWIAVSVLGLIVSIGAIGCKTSPPTVTKFDNKSSGSKPTLADLPAAPALGTSDAVAGKDLPKDGSIPLDGRRDRTGWNENHDAFK